MQQILSAQAKTGMILAKDVMMPDGRVLCGRGTVMTGPLLDRLIKMDIMQITVDGHPVKVPGEKTLKEELRDIEDRFSLVTKVAPLMYIKKRIMRKTIDSRR